MSEVPSLVYILKAIEIENGKMGTPEFLKKINYLVEGGYVDISEKHTYKITEKGKEMFKKYRKTRK